MKFRRTGTAFVALTALGFWAPRVSAEGSAQVGTNQNLQADTEMYVDILAVGEQIRWTTNGPINLYVDNPAGTRVAGITPGQTYTAVTSGAHRVTLSRETGVGTLWDITVTQARDGMGRLHSKYWRFDTGSYGESAATDGSFYALVPGGASGRSGVMELDLDGLAGYRYSIGANQIGVTGINAGKSVRQSLGDFAPGYELYLLPPQSSTYDAMVPSVNTFAFSGGPTQCSAISPGSTQGTFGFNSNIDGTYHLVCDVNKDGVFDRVSQGDYLKVGLAQAGTNTLSWDGTDNAGAYVASGSYPCKVFLNVGEMHYVGEDIETSYQGLRMFAVAGDLSRETVPMFWNDSLVIAEDLALPNNEVAPTTSGAAGFPLDPSSHPHGSAAAANVNARAWGQFTTGGRGDGSFLDTYAYLETSVSTTINVLSVPGAQDTDGDTLTDIVELCTLATEPANVDTDGDGIRDNVEAPAGAPVDTDMDGTIDALDTDSDGDGVTDDLDTNRTSDAICQDSDNDGCDDCSVVPTGGGSPLNDGTDTDADGLCNSGDPDDDNDGVADASDTDALSNLACQDVDSDTCDDCTVVHTGGGNTGNDGVDTDLDGACNAGDPDDDGDGVADGADIQPLMPQACQDLDGDTCDDCAAVPTGGGNIANDGVDSDADGICDAGDIDDDNDGVLDAADLAPTNPLSCRDTDLDSCDDCSTTGANGSGGDPSNDGTDRNKDGICDANDRDMDGDGVTDPYDPDADGDGAVGEPTTDTDGDGLADHLDLDTDNDGIPDTVESGHGSLDLDRDGRLDDLTDSDRDGVPDSVDPERNNPSSYGEPIALDTDKDGLPDYRDLDADGDGLVDRYEGGAADPRIAVFQGADTNRNGLLDAIDPRAGGTALPLPDTNKDGVPNFQDVDSDADGVTDANEAWDGDSNGLGEVSAASTDTDKDGINDAFDPDTNTQGPALPDTDKDGAPNPYDSDDDGDGLLTRKEDLNGNKSVADDDTDQDRRPNYLDRDDDGDGANSDTEGNDPNGDGDPSDARATLDRKIPDYLNPKAVPTDSDGDGIPDITECPTSATLDTDNDGLANCDDNDDDNDGLLTLAEQSSGTQDTNGDGTLDYLDADDDGDGIPTKNEAADPDGNGSPEDARDSDQDGIPDYRDADDDGDGVVTSKENGAALQDSDEDGIPDYLDVDDDGDGIPTAEEGGDPNGDGLLDDAIDVDRDGIPDYLDPEVSRGSGAYLGGGGGNCSATPQGGSARLAWIFALAALVMGGRRRRTLG